MYVKLLGSALVLFSSAMIGFIVANSFSNRPKTLRSLCVALSMLETEIGYGHTPLAEALENVSTRSDVDVAKLFSATRTYMAPKEGLAPDQAWHKALDEYFFNSPLNKEDKDVLENLGKYLGLTDCKDQIKHIKLATTNLRHLETMAIDDREKNEKLWKYLGVLSGIMIVLLLF